jgi:hypothetical protein
MAEILAASGGRIAALALTEMNVASLVLSSNDFCCAIRR